MSISIALIESIQQYNDAIFNILLFWSTDLKYYYRLVVAAGCMSVDVPPKLYFAVTYKCHNMATLVATLEVPYGNHESN